MFLIDLVIKKGGVINYYAAPFLESIFNYAFTVATISLKASTFTLPVLTSSTPLSTTILPKPGIL